MSFDVFVLRQPRADLFKKIVVAVIADVLVGFAIAFNACAGLGNDPISVLYHGLHSRFGISLGLASNIVNYVAFAVVLIFGRRYINIGTFIYTLPLGFFINVGTGLYGQVAAGCNGLIFRIFVSVVACLMLFLGVGTYIALEIGVDPWTGIALMLADRTRIQYKFLRMFIDVSSLAVGFLLGGGFGATTVAVAIFGGPFIQAFSRVMQRLLPKVLRLSDS